MKKDVDVARMIHVTEIAWVLAWLALGVVILIGLNSSFESSHGERNLWQLIFSFLS